MIVDACEFTEEMYDMDRDEAERYITANSQNDFLYIKFTWQQLGLTKEWYTKECRALANDTLIIRRELDLVWTKATDNSVFSEEQLELISSMLVEEPVEKRFLTVSSAEDDVDGEIQEKFALKIYRPLVRDKRYLIGVDTSGGTGKDSSAFTVVDPIDLKPCAVFRNNKINTAYYCSVLLQLVTDVLPNSILVIERNSYGKAVIDQLVRKIPEKIFYDYPLQDKDKSKRVVKRDNIKYGVDTTTQSRDAMIDLLFQIVEDESGALAIKELYDEVRTLIYNSKGKVEHEKGCHDDVVFSYLFVRYVVAYANSISLFLRNGRKSIVENAKTIVGSGVNAAKSISDLNRVERPSEAVESLSLEEIIDLRERGIDIVKYAKQKMTPQAGGRELHINSSILSTMRK